MFRRGRSGGRRGYARLRAARPLRPRHLGHRLRLLLHRGRPEAARLGERPRRRPGPQRRQRGRPRHGEAGGGRRQPARAGGPARRHRLLHGRAGPALLAAAAGGTGAGPPLHLHLRPAPRHADGVALRQARRGADAAQQRADRGPVHGPGPLGPHRGPRLLDAVRPDDPPPRLQRAPRRARAEVQRPPAPDDAPQPRGDLRGGRGARIAVRRALLLLLPLLLTACHGRRGPGLTLLTAPQPGLTEDAGDGSASDPPIPDEEYALASDEGKSDAPALPALFGDLKEIESRGVLRVIIHGAEEDYLPRAGMPATYDRQLAREFAARHHLKLQLVLVDAFDQMIPMLLAGKGDVIAANFTVTAARSEKVDFTRPVAVVKEVVVGQKGAQLLPDTPADLEGREVHVRPSSPFAETLAGLKAKVKVVPAPETLDQEELTYAVSRGERPLTVVDSNTLQAVQAYN